MDFLIKKLIASQKEKKLKQFQADYNLYHSKVAECKQEFQAKTKKVQTNYCPFKSEKCLGEARNCQFYYEGELNFRSFECWRDRYNDSTCYFDNVDKINRSPKCKLEVE